MGWYDQLKLLRIVSTLIAAAKDYFFNSIYEHEMREFNYLVFTCTTYKVVFSAYKHKMFDI